MHASIAAASAQEHAHNGAARQDGPGWQAELALHFAQRRDKTVLVTRRQRGPLLVQRPFYPEGDGVCHTYVLHPPAGLVGGDALRLNVSLETGAHALMTTPAATRWYFSRGREASMLQQATVEDGATLEWLPQETLLFDGAHARLATRIHLRGGARFLGWEILGFGRPACAEVYQSGAVDFRFELHRDGVPALLERLRGGNGGFPGMRGAAACATLIATHAGAAALERARGVIAEAREATSGATLIGDVLLCRAIAAHCQPLLATFTRLWQVLRPELLRRQAVLPRIWRT